MPKLTDKVAVITGASQGIGRAIALAFAKEGASLILASRNEAKLAKVADEARSCGALQVLTCGADVTSESDVAKVFDLVRRDFGRLDLLVNNAGAFDGGPLDQLSLEAWNKVIAVNLTGPFLCTREALRIMKPQGRGRIINIGSISAQRVRPSSAPYSASKHGLWGLTQCTALEGREYGVTCCCLHPGNTMVERRATDKPEDAEPMIATESIAEVALLMATLPDDAAMLEAIVLPREQLYVGRG
jgi:NAD(P)-dependent dehydrogenase (short-subunit alcohol dehydrogenase family)